jgi:hypothetical protein
LSPLGLDPEAEQQSPTNQPQTTVNLMRGSKLPLRKIHSFDHAVIFNNTAGLQV